LIHSTDRKLFSGWDPCQKLSKHDEEWVFCSCRSGFFDWRGKHPLVLWPLITLFVVGNVWYDYHNPAWAIVDGVVLVIGVCAYLVA